MRNTVIERFQMLGGSEKTAFGLIVWEMALVALPPVVVALGSYFLLGIEVNLGQATDTSKERHTHHYGVPHEKPSH